MRSFPLLVLLSCGPKPSPPEVAVASPLATATAEAAHSPAEAASSAAGAASSPAGAASSPAGAASSPAGAASSPAGALQAAFDHGAADGVLDPALAALLEAHWQALMRRNPIWASSLGDRRYDHLLPGTTPAALAEGRAQRDAFLEQARALRPASAADQLTLRLFIEQLETAKAEDVCQFERWSLMPRDNPVTTLGWLPELRPLDDLDDGARLQARYAAFGATVEGQLENLRLGAQAGQFANAESTRRVLEMVRRQLDTPTSEWAAVSRARFKSDVPDAEVEAFRLDLVRTLDTHARPALEAYATFLETEILPHARSGAAAGLTGLGPRGGACYTALVRTHTSLQRAPEVIHQQGLDALAGIHDELRALGATALGTDALPEIFARLRTDKALYFDSSEEIEAKAREALARANAKTPAYFGRVPEIDCVVSPIPPHEAPYTTIAYYQPPPGDGSRPGEYRINTYAPETRPRHEAEVLAFHEAVPGHHLQIAIARRLTDLPAFRRQEGVTVYVEGWALYTERLADEMGLYSGDLDRLGMLSFDAWRAARLVVDTGVHHKGWTREEAVAFMLENTPLAPNNIDNEVDRYVSWPGQALGYKTGQLELRRMRAEAQAALGDRFDLAEFHDVVLGTGPVPMGVVEDAVKAWVAAAQGPAGG